MRYEESRQDSGKLKRRQQALWEADRATWRTTQPFMADLADALTLVPVIDDCLPSATTDGRSLFFNARFSAELNAVTRRFLQAHLVWHCVLGHISGRQASDPHRWHLARDHEVNCLLVHLGIALPDNAVLFFAQFGKPAKALYDWLLNHPAPQLEQPLDLAPMSAVTTLTTNRNDDAMADVPDNSLIRDWRIHAGLLARDYRGTPYLPATVDAALRALERPC